MWTKGRQGFSSEMVDACNAASHRPYRRHAKGGASDDLPVNGATVTAAMFVALDQNIVGAHLLSFSLCSCAVCIHSPPHGPGLTNPDTYYEKFRKFGDIVFVTVCLNNGILMKVGS